MLKITNNDLIKRDDILQTHKLFTSFLTKDIINTLAVLFEKDNKTEHTIIKYIENERRIRGLNTDNITIKSEIYGHNDNNSTLYLGIIRDAKDFIHLALHISPDNLNPKHAGIIHICKDIYIKSKTMKKKYSPFLYPLIKVEQPVDKPNSLHFSITDGYTTYKPPNSNLYEPDIQEEMDVIITVLNKMFDEDNDYYVGKLRNIHEIHPKINNVLTNINKRNKLATRKNKGSLMFNINTSTSVPIVYRKHKNTTRKRIKNKSTNNSAINLHSIHSDNE